MLFLIERHYIRLPSVLNGYVTGMNGYVTMTDYKFEKQVENINVWIYTFIVFTNDKNDKMT